MLYHNLTLSARPGNWRLFSARKADPAFLKFSERIFLRDNYTCQFCGFQARQFQEVVNLDRNFYNTKFSNMVTSCCFCAQCFFLEAVGRSDYGGGRLIFLPEIAQADLNGLCHVLFCAIANASSYRTDAQSIYRNLKFRSQLVEQELGEGMSNPRLFGQILIETDTRAMDRVNDEIFSKLRLLPSRTKFNVQIETWAEAALEELST
ncbi:MAG: HNH endonuclease [Gammaproteobacteria bacterium]|nr:HNH endonuclease [Gammaproteobacteria bacterium]